MARMPILRLIASRPLNQTRASSSRRCASRLSYPVSAAASASPSASAGLPR